MKRALFLTVMMAFAPTVFAQTTGNPATSAKSRSDAYYHFSKARLLDEDGTLTEAIDEYKKALEADPNNSLIFSAMAESYLRNLRIQDAVDAAEKAVQLDTDNEDAHQLLSDVYMNMIANTQNAAPSRQNINKAIHEFEELVRIDPSEQRPYLMLGRLYQAIGDGDKAEAIYKNYLNSQPGSEDGVMALARLQIDSGNNEAAARLLEEFLKSRGDSDRAWEVLGETYGNLNDNKKAATAYRKAIELGSDSMDLLSEYGQALFYDNQYEEARKVYEELLQDDPNDALSLLRLGQIARDGLKYDEARGYLERAEKAVPAGNLEIEFNLAMLDRDEGKFEDALQRINDIVRRTERATGVYSENDKHNRALFLTNQAMLNSMLGRFDQAVESFKNLRTIAEDKERVDTFIIDTYRTARENDKALALVEYGLKENPNNRTLQIIYADMIAEKGRVDEGIRLLQKVAPPDTDLEVAGAMIDIYERVKKYDQAQDVIDAALAKSPMDPQIHFLQGSLYERQKKFGPAEQAFRKSLELDKDNPQTLNYLGYMLTERGNRLEEALALIQKAVDSDPNNGAYLDSLGWAYFKLGRYEPAELYLRKAVRFVVTSATMQDHLGDLYFKLKRYSEAAAAWTKAQALATDGDEAEKIRKKLDQVKSKVVKNN